MVNSIRPEELQQLWERDPQLELIDVRTPIEFREAHVAFARNVPLDRLSAAECAAGRSQNAQRPVYFICRSGARGKMACEKLGAAGFAPGVNIEGGTDACIAAGLPVIRGKKAISLERQVRIAAGALVVLGSALGYFVHPVFLGLAAFVGAGLMFAGITDTCAMGMLIARLPWNQCQDTPGQASCSS